MSCSDRHIAMEVGQHDARSRVDILCAKSCRPAILVSVPANSSSAVVKQIVAPAYIAKIAQAVVRAVTVNVVNIIRLFAMNKEPSKPVSQQTAPLMVDPDVSIGVKGSCRSNLAATDGLNPANDSSFGVIAKAFTDRIRNNFRSHAENLLSVVRGLVVGATSTPIIPSVSNIGKEFAVSGGNSRGTHGTTLCSTIRQPL